MLDNLTQRLAKVVKTMRGEARLTESNTADMLREVRLALLEADVALPAVREFITRVKEKALGENVIGSLTPGQALVGVVQQELASLMGADLGPEASQLSFATQPPAIILMAGLQGAGKTTTVGKLAKYLREEKKKKVLTVSADVYRPAAIGQLQTVTAQVGADFFPSQPTDKPIDIALAALDYAKRHYHDVLIIDTAGRLGIDEAMMQEIAALHAAVKPIETLFVVDAMLGQDAINTAKAFNDALPLTGIVLTKLDGDARGGAALSVRHITGKPIKFAGVAEKLDGLEAFDPQRMANRILGMGDILALVEEARKGVDIAAAQDLAQKNQSGRQVRLERLQGPTIANEKDGWPVQPDGQAPGTVAASGQWRQHGPSRKASAAHGRDHQLDDATGTHQTRTDQGVAQAPHRHRCRRAGTRSQPHAGAIRANAINDEKAQGRRHDENDAWHEGHATGLALRRGLEFLLHSEEIPSSQGHANSHYLKYPHLPLCRSADGTAFNNCSKRSRQCTENARLTGASQQWKNPTAPVAFPL